MSYRYSLTFLGLLLVTVGLFERGWLLLAVWLGCNFLALGIAHTCGIQQFFGKRADGALPIWSWLIFLPLFLYTGAVWHIARLINREPAFNTVTKDLVVGRRLLSGELNEEFANYIDLTAEFAEPTAIRRSGAYLSFPILDGAAPDPTSLRDFLDRLRPGKTFVHCAQGHGRTGLFAVAFLLKSGIAPTAEECLARLQSIRPGIRLNKAQRMCVDEFTALLKS
jgi:protein-tyrosine phosphatase